jgi:outer membrane protein assembly factor BamE (lipoprotein component of BamABCDE complex)
MRKTRISTPVTLTLVVAVGALVAGCGSTGKITKHGHHLRPADIQQVQPGMGKDEVRLALGTPTTQSRKPNGDAFYYVSSTTKQQAFFKPQEIDRKILAVYFSPLGSVQRVANYGLKDGKVFDYVTRTTPSANTKDESIVQMLFRNIGERGIAAQGS